jgi:multicomponent K+:H+ antiporter subunit D
VAPRFAQTSLVGGLFFLGAIAMAGMPPLSGFIGKLLILDSARSALNAGWIWGLILGTSLLAMVGFSRGGSTLFWKSTAQPGNFEGPAPARPALPLVAASLLLAGSVLLTVFAGPVTVYLDETAAQLFAPLGYVDAVLGAEGGNE